MSTADVRPSKLCRKLCRRLSKENGKNDEACDEALTGRRSDWQIGGLFRMRETWTGDPRTERTILKLAYEDIPYRSDASTIGEIGGLFRMRDHVDTRDPFIALATGLS